MYRERAKGWLKHVDFMLLDVLSLELSFVLAYWIRMRSAHAYARSPYVGKIKGRNPLRNLIAFVLSGKKERLFDYLKRILEKNDMYSEYDYAELYYGLTISYDRSIFESYSDVEFEGKKLSMMTDYMGYLETRYGRKEFYRDDANAKPPHLVYVSTDKSYEDFKIENISSDCVVARNKPF